MRQRYEVVNDAFLPGEIEQTASAGEIVYEFTGHTYECIAPEGLACSREDGVGPFFEIARTNLRRINQALGVTEDE